MHNEVGKMRQEMEGILTHSAINPNDMPSLDSPSTRNGNSETIELGETSEHYAWEKHSTGIARKTLLRMGYKGKGGLGKNENGIEEAITIDNVVRSKKSEKRTLIFSSSITRDINTNGFNKKLKYNKATFHKFNGKKIQHIKRYIPVHLDEEKNGVDSVIIVAGGNDITVGKPNLNSRSVSQIANDIIEAGLLCRNEHGVKHIYISSVLPRCFAYYQMQRKVLNNILKDHCELNGFTFIANDNIILKYHIGHDGVHLNKSGASLLCRNLHYYLNREV